MGRWSRNSQEAKHICDTVIAAVDKMSRNVKIYMNAGAVLDGYIYGMGLQNTNGQEPVNGDIKFSDSSGNNSILDPIDIKVIM